jgi:hypothetical protein
MSGMFRAGQHVEDYCRACKTDREHTVVAVDGDSVRVICGYCQSQHNFRGGPRVEPSIAPRQARPVAASAQSAEPISRPRASASPRDTLPLVSEREEAGLSAVTPAEKWRGGDLVLKPGRPGVQEKSWPIETFFHKIVMLRNRLRTLEQQVNASELTEDQKVRLQGYISGCYGSLTSFNVLFADESDQFKGGGGDV